MNDSQQHRSNSDGTDNSGAPMHFNRGSSNQNNQSNNIFIVAEQYSVANGTSSKEQSSGLDQLASFQIQAHQSNPYQGHNQLSSPPSSQQQRKLSSGKEPSPRQFNQGRNNNGNELGFLGLNNQYVYGAGEGERIVTFSHKIEKKLPQQADSDMFNAVQLFGAAGQNTQGFPGKDGSSIQEQRHILDDDNIDDDDDDDEEQDDDDDSSHFGYQSGSVEDERNQNDESVLTMHMNERVNSIPDEDPMIDIHLGLHFSKNSGNSNGSKQAGQPPTTMIMYETARTSCIEEGLVDPVIKDDRSRVFKNLLGLESSKKERSKQYAGQAVPQSMEPFNDYIPPSGGKQFLNVRFGTIGLGNGSLQGGTECDPLKSNNYCFDTANRNKPSNQVNMNRLYSEIQMEDNGDGGKRQDGDGRSPQNDHRQPSTEPQDARHMPARLNLLPSPNPQHKNIYENSNYNQKQSHTKFEKLRLPPGHVGTGNVESLRSPPHAFNQSSSFAFINNNIQMEQTLDKVSYNDPDKGNGLLHQIEERKVEASKDQSEGGVIGPYYVSNQKLNGSENRGIKQNNVSVKDVDMVIDGSQLYESESEIKRKKRSPYPMGLQAKQKEIPMESMEYPLTVSQSQNKSGFISQNLMTSKLTSNNTLVQQALAHSNNGPGLGLREQSHLLDSSSNHMLLAPQKNIPSLKQPVQNLPTLPTPTSAYGNQFKRSEESPIKNEKPIKNGASLPPKAVGTLGSNALSHAQSEWKIESDMAKRDFALSSLDMHKQAVMMGGSGIGNTTGAAARKKSAFKQNSKLNKTLNKNLTKLNTKEAAPHFNKTINPTRGKVTLNIDSGLSAQEDSRNNEEDEEEQEVEGFEQNNEQNTSRPTNINILIPGESHNQISDMFNEDRVEQNSESGDESTRNKQRKRKVIFNNEDSRCDDPKNDSYYINGVGGKINQYPTPLTESQFGGQDAKSQGGFDASNPSFRNIPRKFVSKRTDYSPMGGGGVPGGQIGDNWKDSASFSFVASNNLGGKNVSRAITKHTDFTPKHYLEEVRQQRRRSNLTNVVRGTTLQRLARGVTKSDAIFAKKEMEKEGIEKESHKESKYHHSDNTAKIDQQLNTLKQNIMDNMAKEKLKTMDPKSLFIFTQTSLHCRLHF
ncbi:hypothetical protein FGO68_gene6030 [Halteria grandinella]|uniref:Uncharacterized protein n=1 Tax=Halteria grandinella TaxID=5974 RepID=A0A8J8TA45_HALGN|nr:hypothetical protein FGO68_gene6030 [Halteria grandinella]